MSSKGKKFVNNGSKVLCIEASKVEEFLRSNPEYTLGRLKGVRQSHTSRNKGKVYVTNGSESRSFNSKELAQSFINSNPGWRFGNALKGRESKLVGRTRYYIHKIDDDKIQLKCFLSIEERDEYLSENSDWNTGGKKIVSESTRRKLKHTQFYVTNERISRWFNSESKVKEFLKNNPGWRRGKAKEGKRGPMKDFHKESIRNGWTPEKRHAARVRALNQKSGYITHSKNELKVKSYYSNYFLVDTPLIQMIDGSYHEYDIRVILPNGVKVLIEYDGDYFHSPDNPRYSEQRDKLRETTARALGYEFFIIKEGDFLREGLKLAKRLLAEIYPPLNEFHLDKAQEIKDTIYQEYYENFSDSRYSQSKSS